MLSLLFFSVCAKCFGSGLSVCDDDICGVLQSVLGLLTHQKLKLWVATASHCMFVQTCPALVILFSRIGKPGRELTIRSERPKTNNHHQSSRV